MSQSRQHGRRKPQGSPRRGEGAAERRPLAEWLSVRLDIPSDVLDGGFRLEMRGRHSLVVHGCCRIEDFSPERVSLRLRANRLTVCGKRLICTSYLAGAVGIEGCICGISLEDGEVEA